jgi:CheY-like chemotaxis protein
LAAIQFATRKHSSSMAHASVCLFLLDMMMPVMDGQTFLDTLHHMHRVAPIPVVIVSAGATADRVRGAARFVKRPVAPSVLTTIVREYGGPA